MSENFFVIQNGSLTVMQQANFETEAIFQKLLADLPGLLSQIPGPSPRKFILVGREVRIEVDDDEAFRLDHLFLDQDGTLTLVEVKRQGDPRLKREVVGQLLGYAADALHAWSIDELRRKFAELQSTTLEKLQQRLYKWDWVDTPTPGKKIDSNWIKGDIFLKVCREKEGIGMNSESTRLCNE